MVHSSRISDTRAYTPRTLQSFVELATRDFPVVLVTGARQVGKTTLLQHLRAPQRAYVSLDDPLVLGLAREDPALFFQRFPPPVLIDEVQYAPGLLPYVKIDVDRRGEPGSFWLTGSQQFQVMKEASESLAGRVAVVQLHGLSRRELLGRGLENRPFVPTPEGLAARAATSTPLSMKELYRLIWRGALPAVALNDRLAWDLFHGSYVKTYLERDVRSLANVGNEQAFMRFLRVTAARTSQILNLAAMARDAEVSPNTAKTWLSLLQASGIAYLLEPYHTNVNTRLVKAPKLYVLDTGLGAYLTQWSSPEVLEAGAMSGAFLETWAVGEL
ncbi:MAG: ATP-binding protein, partial [Candidatus Riflebacteria bacterium]|nr:ATP-binding protein [Candidatus Riflebacteria bacterium]